MEKVGIVGNGFVGNAVAKGFNLFAETKVYEKVRFEIGLDGFTDAVLVTDSVLPSEGVGTQAQLAIFERQASMNDGQAWVQAYPSVQERAEVAKVTASLFPFDQVIIDNNDFVSCREHLIKFTGEDEETFNKNKYLYEKNKHR